MLTIDVHSHTSIIEALQFFHRHGNLTGLPGGIPAGVVVNATDITVDYGFGATTAGRIKLALGQFAITQVSNNGVGNLQNLSTYNHSGTNQTQQNYIDALKNTNLNGNQTHVSAIIILTSECCRSELVFGAIQKLMTSGVPFSTDVWAGLNFAFTNYSHTATAAGYNIQALGTPWTTLRLSNYQSYVNSQAFTGDKKTALAQLQAVQQYINT